MADDLAGMTVLLRRAGSVYAEDEAALLRREAVDAAQLTTMVARRATGEPIELVVGWAAFCGLRVRVEAGVFVPRLRTELLAELAVAATPVRGVVVDLCCGAAPVAAVVHDRVPLATVHAADLSPAAVACARQRVGVRVHKGDLFDALPRELAGLVDVLAVNAPYVPTGEIRLMPREASLHEPHDTLDGGADGAAFHRRVADQAPAWLSPGGTVLIETSARQQGVTAGALVCHGFSVHVERDDDRDATVVVGRLAA